MAGTTITNLLEIIQRKIDAADSTSATQDLLYLLSAVRQGDGSSLELYDSTGAFPDLTDSAADTEMIGYKLDSDRLYFNVGVWKGKTLPPPPPDYFYGTVRGYLTGGGSGASGSNLIQYFSFASDGNSIDGGADLPSSREGQAGHSSPTHGYVSGGTGPSYINVIEKFPFSVDTNATDVGDLLSNHDDPVGNSSNTYGYTSGGYSFFPGPNDIVNVIQKFPFSVDENSTDVGDLTQALRNGTDQNSLEYGYVSGGLVPPNTNLNNIEKFPFASDGNATDVGDLTLGRDAPAGQSSATHGYTSGGPVSSNVIEKFPFASDTNASDVGDLTIASSSAAGQSSASNGYHCGGFPTPAGQKIMNKFPFASDANASDIGQLTAFTVGATGHSF